MVVHAKCGATALFKFTEAWTGGGTSPTGTITAYNKNRNSDNTSGLVISYDATEVTGGIVLETEYVATGKFGAGETRSAQEWVLKQNTNYAVSLFLAGANEASIGLDYYEHTNKAI